MWDKLKEIGRKRIIFAAVTVIMVVFLVLLGPADHFCHGFYCDTVACDRIPEEDFLGSYDLSDMDYETTFVPSDRHFAGFGLWLTGMQTGDAGTLIVSTYTQKGKKIETIEIDTGEIIIGRWWMVYTSAHYKEGTRYRLTIQARDCAGVPQLLLVPDDYLSGEGQGNHLLMSYAYAKPTFSFGEKTLIFVFTFAVWCFALGGTVFDGKKRKYAEGTALFALLTALLAWNYMYGSFNENNKESFAQFQADSETLVTGVIEAESAGMPLSRYGLGRYTNVKGEMYSYQNEFKSDEEWDEGYHLFVPFILLSNNEYVREIAQPGNTIRFANGEEIGIAEVLQRDYTVQLTLAHDQILPRDKYGSLEDARFYSGGQPLPAGRLQPYVSQYGLQGKVFRHLAGFFAGDGYRESLYLLCCIAAAVVFTAIVFLLRKKYNALMAGCFYVAFLLSPWVVNFARNLYWVEFTWFLPMLVGLVCAVWIQKRFVRVACYAASFAAIAVKCLCGYEYLPVIMLGMIVFLLTDWILAMMKKDRRNILLLFRTIFIMGIMAILGFMAAICMHAAIRGEGNMTEGIRQIIASDVLRRVGGGSMNDFAADLWPSLNASVWEVLCRYFHFETEIVAGVDGTLFPVLCMTSAAILLWDYKKKRMRAEELVMYIVFFLTCISWFVLGKAHSYVHTHINFVMWYFGYIQICFYVIIRKAAGFVRKEERKET